MNNPWKLNDRQCVAMATLVDKHCVKAVADVLGVSHHAGCNIIRRCCTRMAARSAIHAALLWDRWKRRQGGAA